MNTSSDKHERIYIGAVYANMYKPKQQQNKTMKDNTRNNKKSNIIKLSDEQLEEARRRALGVIKAIDASNPEKLMRVISLCKSVLHIQGIIKDLDNQIDIDLTKIGLGIIGQEIESMLK